MRDAYICDAVRTPVGRHSGALAAVRADDLAALPLKALMERNPGLDPEAIEDVIFGCANQAGEDNRNVARMAVLLAGLPESVPGSTVNRLCGSSLDAVGSAARAVRLGEADLMIAGGVESMSARALCDEQVRRALGPRRADVRYLHRLALRQPPDGGGVRHGLHAADGREPGHRAADLPRGPGRLRGPQPAARRPRPGERAAGEGNNRRDDPATARRAGRRGQGRASASPAQRRKASRSCVRCTRTAR